MAPNNGDLLAIKKNSFQIVMRCVEFLAIIPALVFRMCGPFDGDDRRGPVQHLVVIYRGSGCDNSHLEDIVVSNKVSRRHGPDLSHFTWIYRCL